MRYSLFLLSSLFPFHSSALFQQTSSSLLFSVSSHKGRKKKTETLRSRESLCTNTSNFHPHFSFSAHTLISLFTLFLSLISSTIKFRLSFNPRLLRAWKFSIFRFPKRPIRLLAETRFTISDKFHWILAFVWILVCFEHLGRRGVAG